MRIVKSILLGAAILAVLPATAGAQERRIHFTFGGGPTFVASNIGDVFSTGIGPAVGVTFEANNHFGLGFEYAFRRFHAERYVDSLLGEFTAYHDTHQLGFNFIWNITDAASRVRVYASAGPAAYYRDITITEYVGTGIVCDPWWYICGTYPITDIVGSRGGWDFGFSVGGGIGIKLGSSEDVEFTIESKYHFVQGPTVTAGGISLTNPDGSSKANGHYIPLTFGFRF